MRKTVRGDRANKGAVGKSSGVALPRPNASKCSMLRCECEAPDDSAEWNKCRLANRSDATTTCSICAPASPCLAAMPLCLGEPRSARRVLGSSTSERWIISKMNSMCNWPDLRFPKDRTASTRRSGQREKVLPNQLLTPAAVSLADLLRNTSSSSVESSSSAGPRNKDWGRRRPSSQPCDIDCEGSSSSNSPASRTRASRAERVALLLVCPPLPAPSRRAVLALAGIDSSASWGGCRSLAEAERGSVPAPMHDAPRAAAVARPWPRGGRPPPPLLPLLAIHPAAMSARKNKIVSASSRSSSAARAACASALTPPPLISARHNAQYSRRAPQNSRMAVQLSHRRASRRSARTHSIANIQRPRAVSSACARRQGGRRAIGMQADSLVRSARMRRRWQAAPGVRLECVRNGHRRKELRPREPEFKRCLHSRLALRPVANKNVGLGVNQAHRHVHPTQHTLRGIDLREDAVRPGLSGDCAGRRMVSGCGCTVDGESGECEQPRGGRVAPARSVVGHCA
eukprot:scaffold19271_cov28-Tisochrysis_lutea.AAC.3